VADSVSVAQNQSVSIDVVGNDSDPEGVSLAISAVETPSSGSIVSFDTTNITYTSAVSGLDTFTYTVTDGSNSATNIVSVQVLPQPMLAMPDAEGDIVALTASTVTVPIELSNSGGLYNAVSVDLNYDENCLQYNSIRSVNATESNILTSTNSVAFDANSSSLSDGTLVELIFDANPNAFCPSDSANANIFVNTAISITMGAAPDFTLITPNNGVSNVEGTLQEGRVAIVQNNARGDCNGDGAIDAGDLSAVIIESFDTSNGAYFWLYAYESPIHAGSPYGCDVESTSDLSINANPRSFVEIPDLICLIFVLFGNDSCTVPATVTSASSALLAPTLTNERQVSSQATLVEVPIMLQDGQDKATSANFTINFDTERFSFVELRKGESLPSGMEIAQDTEEAGVVQAAFYTIAFPMPTIADGELATLVLEVKADQEAAISEGDIEIISPSVGTIDGTSAADSLIVIDLGVLGTGEDTYNLYMPLILR